MTSFKVGTAAAAPGARADGTFPVPLPGATQEVPVIVLNGGDGPTVAVTAGIHGAEYCGMDAILTLARETDPGKLKGRLILVPCVNLAGFFSRSVYVNPLDGKNLNRVFPGSSTGTASEVLAAAVVEHVLEPCDYFIDLHGGDMVEALEPFVIWCRSGVPEVDRKAEQLARGFGLDLIVETGNSGTTLGAAARLGKPSVLGEAGGQGILDPAGTAILLEGTSRVLRLLEVLPGTRPQPTTCPSLGTTWMRSGHRAMFYPAVTVGQEVKAGEKLGEMRDLYGKLIEEVISPATGSILFLVTSLASNPGDPLLAVAGPA